MNQTAKAWSPDSPYSFWDDPIQAMATYLEVGFHIEPEVFTTEECEKLQQHAASLPNAEAGHYRPQMMPHRHDPIYLAALRHPKLIPIVERMIDGPAMGLQTEYFYGKPGTRGFSKHQDNFYIEAEYNSFVSAWCALVDVTPEKGGLIAYPGSHVEGDLPTRSIHMPVDPSQDPNANNEECMVPDKYPPLSVCVPKGSVFFIHGHLVHASHKNVSNEWRNVLLCTYILRNEYFRPGRYAQRSAVEL